jgi:Gas vesicle synthesis protein GvpL/GvpF
LLAHARTYAFQPPRRHALAEQEKRLLDAALLVAAEATPCFEDAVLAAQDAALAAGCRLTVRGPLPAYSFVAPQSAEAP